LAFLLPRLLKDMLGSEEEMKCEPGDPVWEGDDKVVPFLIVDGCQHLG
jgi:hypothetical protein